MRVLQPHIYPELTNLKDAIFLAGPCPRDENDFEHDWRREAVEIFKKHGFTGDIINPTNPDYGDNYTHQCHWEYKGFCCAAVILFWVPRSKNFPGFTTNVEFGEWMHSHRTVLGFPEGAMHTSYLKAKYTEFGREVCYTLEDTVLEALRLLREDYKQHGDNVFFTADTHFSQERTLQLSMRPFPTVGEMDLQLISNWNKRTNSDSVVFHLGDFGDFSVLPLLNFKTMYLIEGNYEKKEPYTIDDDRVQVVKPGNITLNGKKFFLCHEPLSEQNSKQDEFYLFGHIHKLQLVKRNGINVGIDANRFNLMSVKELEFLYEAVTKHYDENVFTEICGVP